MFLVAGRDSNGCCELFNNGSFQEINKHPLDNLRYFGISRGEDCLLTFGGYGGKGCEPNI